MNDFTLKAYQKLFHSFLSADFSFFTFRDFSRNPHPDKNKFIILRHDVDARPGNALRFAEMEEALGIRGTYYFRIVKGSFDEVVIERIAELGHEIGYHYEDLDLAGRTTPACRTGRDHGPRTTAVGSNSKDENNSELYKTAIELFEKHLEQFRKLYPVKTICMHGSPRSRIDNRDLWKVYDYRDYGIIGEPYFDVDWNEVFYLTDTGRRWDGEKFSVRDKIKRPRTTDHGPQSSMDIANTETYDKLDLKYRSTFDIIEAVENGTFPKQVMVTLHPQRWNDRVLPWLKELFWQNTKNVVKRYFFVK